jgi:hypothetical protein
MKSNWLDSVINLQYTVLHSLFQTYQFEVPESVEEEAEGSSALVSGDFAVIAVVVSSPLILPILFHIANWNSLNISLSQPV